MDTHKDLGKRTSDWMQQDLGLPTSVGETVGLTLEVASRVSRRVYDSGRGVVNDCVEALIAGSDATDLVEGADGIVRFNQDGQNGNPEERIVSEFDASQTDRM